MINDSSIKNKIKRFRPHDDSCKSYAHSSKPKKFKHKKEGSQAYGFNASPPKLLQTKKPSKTNSLGN